MNRQASSIALSESGGEFETYSNGSVSEEELNWFPEILRTVLNVNDIQVLVLDEIDHQIAEDDIGYSQGFGLRHITDMKCSKDGKRHLLYCITTIENIYVLRSTIPSDVAFLKRQLQRQDIEQRRVYLWEGTQLGYYLNRDMNIRLEDQTDLQSFDLNLTLDAHVDEHLNQTAYLTGPYVANVIKPRKKTFYDLIREWLNISPPVLRYSTSEFAGVGQFPLTLTTCNAIKKRCALVRQLGVIMMNTFEARRRRPLKLLYGMAYRSNSEMEVFKNSDQDYADLR